MLHIVRAVVASALGACFGVFVVFALVLGVMSVVEIYCHHFVY